MSEDKQGTESTGEGGAPKKSIGIVVWLVVAIVSVGAGAALPFLLFSPSDADPSGSGKQTLTSNEAPAFVDFGEVVVNLNEPRMNRYLRLRISLVVDKSNRSAVDDAVNKNKANLISWLLSYLADKRMDDIRGGVGQNMLRREMQNHFNAVLFPQGEQRIRNVLFEEFSIQ